MSEKSENDWREPLSPSHRVTGRVSERASGPASLLAYRQVRARALLVLHACDLLLSQHI
jgi:hypothetical protein